MKVKYLLGWIFLLAACSPSTSKYNEPYNPGQVPISEKPEIKPFSGVALDILFVVDNSGSMGEHQQNLARNVGLFVNAFANNKVIQYHVGVVSTDMYDRNDSGRLQGSPLYVENTTPSGLVRLEQNLMLGTYGDSTEAMFDPVYAALSDPLLNGFNRGFYRKDAHLAIVFITDAEDQSDMSSRDLIDYLVKLKGDKEKVLAYGAIIPSTDRTGCPRDDSSKPYELEDFIKYFQGSVFSLCDPDFGNQLASIGSKIMSRIELFIPLGHQAYVPSIKVTYGTQVVPQDINKGWSYDVRRAGLILGRELDLKEEPGATFNVSYVPAKVQ